MDEHSDHKELLESLSEEYSDLLKGSEQAIYIYFDDEHKLCNKKFAELLGYKSESEWANTDGSFPELFVDSKSRETLVSSYQNAMEKGIGSANNITWKKKDGETVKTSVILVPIVHKGHLFALHFLATKPE